MADSLPNAWHLTMCLHAACGSERLRFLESELKQQRLLLASMTVERDNLQEDMWQIKAAKKQSDEVHDRTEHCTVMCAPP